MNGQCTIKREKLEVPAGGLDPRLDIIAKLGEEIDACELLDLIYVRGVLEQTATVVTAVFVDEADASIQSE